MKALLCLLALLVAAPAIAQTHPDLRTDLLAMVAADQEVRQRVIAAGIPTDSAGLEAFKASDLGREMVQGDSSRLARVVQIVDTHGWPTSEMVSRDGVNAAFLIVQHADLETQERMLPLVEASWQAGDLMGQSYALLLDRVLVGRGEPQVYGTQTLPPSEWTDGEPALAPVAEPDTLDTRRAEMGLPSAEAYLALLKSFYTPETDDASPSENS